MPVSLSFSPSFAADGDPKNYMAYYSRATVFLAMGKSKSALPDLGKVIELKPDFTSVSAPCDGRSSCQQHSKTNKRVELPRHFISSCANNFAGFVLNVSFDPDYTPKQMLSDFFQLFYQLQEQICCETGPSCELC